MERLTERNPLWMDDEMWERACEPDCEEIDAVYRKLKEYEDAEEQGLPNRWIPCSERLPECCGYPVLLTVENGFNQRHVCKAFTNYMKEGKLLFLTNEKEYCEELISSKLSNAWKPIAWMPLPEPYGESEGADGE